VHPARTIRDALTLAGTGASATVIGRQLGVPRSTIRDWLAGSVPRHSLPGACDRCGGRHPFPDLPRSYVYLLGLYLGDGCISVHARDVYRLRIVLDVRYPEIILSAAEAMAEVRGGPANSLLRPENCVEVSAYWRGWPCVFPQHGLGPKHHRRIELTEWQETLVGRDPELLLRGLIHSDGCRFTNTGTNWTCPRYSFSNASDDIRRIFCQACDLVGVRYTHAPRTVYVSRKADVATLDRFIGPKS
jgi:hypothetical protein